MLEGDATARVLADAAPSARGALDQWEPQRGLNATVCVFAKPPRAGEVKTRLAAREGEAQAARLAMAFLRDAWESALRVPWAEVVLASTEEVGSDLLPSLRQVWLQGDGDLGARMERILRRGLAQSPVAIAVGADIPALPARLYGEAQQALQSADAVLGPAADGGFYLLALTRCPEGLLAGIPWSRSDTLVRTMERLEAAGLRTAVISPWFDIDRPEDLDRLLELAREGAVYAPHTLAAVEPEPEPIWLSVVVPTLDEATRMGAQVDRLLRLPGVGEVIVADGGSSDDTVARALAAGGEDPRLRVISVPRGRASQMNHGAAEARGEVLLFLHADVRLPRDAARWIDQTLAEPASVAGAFRTWTIDDTGQGRLGPFLHLADFRSRYSSLPYGDQAIFVRRDTFESLGGFPEMPLMEDLELSIRLRQRGQIVTVPASVEVSGRRFIARPLWYTFLVNVYPALYRLGVSAERLDRWYRAIR